MPRIRIDSKCKIPLDINPRSFGHSGTCVDDSIYCFGGFVEEITSNESRLLTEILLAEKALFYNLTVTGDIPNPRERHSVCAIGTKLYLFGGFNRIQEFHYNDLYYFDTETLTWYELTPKGTLPNSRCGHSSCVLDGKLWIFGGRTEIPGTFLSRGTFKYINDLYCYDPAINEWLKFEPRGIIPSGRAMHTATVIGRKMLIFGGAHSSGTLHDTSGYCDLYELDFDSMTWHELQYNSTPPSPCYGHSATKIDDDNILYFGGRGYLVHNSVHILDTTTLTWTEYSYCGNVLSPRWGHSATLILNRIILYGGRDPDSYLSSVDIIDLDGQLIPKVTEFTPKEKKKFTKRTKEQTYRESYIATNFYFSTYRQS